MSEKFTYQSLGDLLSLEYGSSLPDTIRRKGNVPVYGSNGQVGFHSVSICQGPGIIIGRKGSVGQVCWSKESFWPIDTTYYVRPKKDFELRWLYWLLLHSGLTKLNSSTGVPGLNRNDVYSLFVNCPRLNEQSSIAIVLDTVDEAIQQHETLIAKLRKVKAGMLNDLLTKGLDENGELRDPVRHPEQFKDSQLGKIPKEWDIFPLEKLAQISSGVTLGNTPQGSGTIELPYLRVANVQDGYLDLTDIKQICIYKKDLDRFSLQKGDVLMNEGGDFDKLGRGAVWEGQIGPCLHQNHVFRVRPNPAILDSYFLDAVSGSYYGKSYFILSSKQSTNLASINSTQLKNFSIPCPPIEEQKAIVAILSRQERVIMQEEAVFEKLKRIKQGLMKDLLTGSVRVPVSLQKKYQKEVDEN
jgi:type I restriction enzyme, S subunit